MNNLRIIEGKEAVENAIKTGLNEAEDRLLEFIDGKEPKFRTLVIEVLNYLGRDLVTDHRDPIFKKLSNDALRSMRYWRRVLDFLLQEGHSISPWREEDSLQILKSGELLPFMFFAICISDYSFKLSIQKVWPTEKVKIDKGAIEDLGTAPELYAAIEQLPDQAKPDACWAAYYYSKIVNYSSELDELLRLGFKEEYDLDFGDLDKLSFYFQQVSASHRELLAKKEIISFEEPHYMRFILGPLAVLKYTGKIQFTSANDGDKVIEELTQTLDSRGKALSWLKQLKYEPGKNIFKSPLLEVEFQGESLYTLFYWVFAPLNLFTDAWVGDFLLNHPNSKAAKRWGQLYGEKFFEDFVAEQCKEAGLPQPSGPINIRDTMYPGKLEPYLQRLSLITGRPRRGFSIDRVACTDKFAFLISCKAHDFGFDHRLLSQEYFYPLPIIKKTVSQNVKQLNLTSPPTN